MQYFDDLEVGTVTRFGRYEVTREDLTEDALQKQARYWIIAYPQHRV